MERFCLDCGVLIRGRSDKKFCDDQCRNNYNNRLNSADNSVVKKINSCLKRNRDVLLRLNPTGKNRVSRGKLLESGFNFKYFTHTYGNSRGNVYYFCYEYGYLKLGGDEYLLVKSPDAQYLL